MSVFPPTAKRVFMHTNAHVNESIKNRTNKNIKKHEGPDSETLERRLGGWCPPLPIIRRMGIRTAT